ncbi:MAG: ribonuclease Z [bacterium]
MRIVTLGTSAGRPTPHRSASAAALEFDGDVFLFDCGEGTQAQLARSPLKWGNIRAIFIGHLHGDHVNGLPGLLGTYSLADRQEPLHLFGPPGLKKYLRVLQEVKTLWVNFPFRVTEITAPGVILDDKKFQVETARLDHVIECWGYVFREKQRPGVFDEAKAQAMGIPIGPLRSKLVHGESITLENGLVIQPGEIVGPPRPGRSVAYCLDTCPCQNDWKLASEVDVLIHEATFDDSLRNEMKKWGHSTSAQAAEVALKARANQLILTHISPRYANPDLLLKEAQRVFKNSEMAWDLSEFTVERK